MMTIMYVFGVKMSTKAAKQEFRTSILWNCACNLLHDKEKGQVFDHVRLSEEILALSSLVLSLSNPLNFNACSSFKRLGRQAWDYRLLER